MSKRLNDMEPGKPASDAGKAPRKSARAKPDGGPARGKIRRPSGLVDEVYARIRADIMALKIAPDAHISIDSLARELGVSQTPIREALSMLEATGLVTKQHLVGYCAVPKLNRTQFETLYELRLLLEPYAASKAARHMTPAILEQLRQLSQDMQPDPDGDQRAFYNRFADNDSEFHALLAETSGNPLIAETLARLHVHMHIFRLRFHTEVTTEAYAEHSVIIEALEKGDAQAASGAMRAHLESSYRRLVHFTEP
ncbi:GntR family transcriptional regulator [Castellaniella sp. GW247-6E4]|uniref:GntR family transcriptional regulator n=1 Tax=Castellaniella sp. GW247-6E4 TaxID=3140380 RepID=UPI0033161692